MSYKLLDPLHRDREFRLFEQGLERNRFFNVIESIIAEGVVPGGDFSSDLVQGGNAKSGLGKLLGWNKKTSFMDRVQDTVDIVGVVDPTGIADGANALAYAARGKWTDAATSALGMIPYLGDVAKLRKLGRGAKLGGKAAKVEREALKIAEKKAAKRQLAKRGERGGFARRAVGAARQTRFVRGLEAGAKRKLGRHGRSALKLVSGEGKLRGRAGKIAQRVQDFRKTGAGQKIEKGVRDKFGRRPTGPASKEAPPPSLAPPDAGELARQREREQKAQPQPAPKRVAGPPTRRKFVGDAAPGAGAAAGGERPAAAHPEPAQPKADQGGGGGSSQGPRGATIVPVDARCPSPKTKTSTDRAGGGKRCNKQTIPRNH